jgi:hypothetical protein
MYLYSTFPLPILFTGDVISGKISLPPARSLILGDSTAAFAYRAEKLPRALSLAMFASSPVENYYSLTRYLEKIPPPRCIFLSSSYAWKYQRDYGFWETFVFHGFYSWAELAEIQRAGGNGGGFWERARFYVKAFLYRAGLAGIHFELRRATLLETLMANKRENEWNQEHLRAGLGTLQISTWDYIHDDASLSHLREPFEPSALLDAYLERILALAESRHIRVFWVQPPVLDTYLDDPVRQHYAALNAHLAPLLARHRGTVNLGALRPYPSSLMLNPVHPNPAGSAEFTLQMKPLFEGCQ